MGKEGVGGHVPAEEACPDCQPQDEQHAGKGKDGSGRLRGLILLCRGLLCRLRDGGGLYLCLMGELSLLRNGLPDRLGRLRQMDAIAHRNQKAEEYRQPDIIGEGLGHLVSQGGADQPQKHAQQGAGQGEREQREQNLFHVDSS